MRLLKIRPASIRYLGARLASINSSQSPSKLLAESAARPKNWLTRRVEASPSAFKIFLGVANSLGYGSPKQLAGRRAFVLYEQVCATEADEEKLFWQDECHLPPTFQSWFTVTNLHVWLLTVRLRALPQPHGISHIQGLIDHFFIDVEDRIRAILQPHSGVWEPYTFISGFYTNPNAPALSDPNSTRDKSQSKRLTGAPDRLVTRQMKIFKEQWAGMGMAFDMGLVKGDMEMAGAAWRNLLGGRGARGIVLPTPTTSMLSSSASPPHFRRSVNLVGGEAVNVAKIDIDKEEAQDDESGVHDFLPEDMDKYVGYPELMLDLVRYVRKELVRLEALSDEEIMNGEVGRLRFGRAREGKPQT